MTEKEPAIEMIETMYEVYHAAGNHFHGNSSLWIAVLAEDDHTITGYEWGPRMDQPGERVTVVKDNVAGWKERVSALEQKIQRLEGTE